MVGAHRLEEPAKLAAAPARVVLVCHDDLRASRLSATTANELAQLGRQQRALLAQVGLLVEVEQEVRGRGQARHDRQALVICTK